MSKGVLRLLVLLVGVGVSLYAQEPWSYAGLVLVALVVLDVLGAARHPVKEWATVAPQNVTVLRCDSESIEVIKVLREYLEPDPGAAVLRSYLAATPCEVGQVPSAAAAKDLSARLKPLQAQVTYRPAS